MTTDATIINYAKTIIDAISIRENSYNHEAADLETESFKRKYTESWIMPDYTEFYTKDIQTSVEEACNKNNLPIEFAKPIILSFNWQNDLIEWVNEILEK